MAEETDEAAALRAENAELQRRNQELLKQVAHVPAGRRAVNALRATSVVVLLLLGAICATAAVPAIWSRNLVLNTDRYVETLTPLASDPGLQAGIVKAIDKQFADNVDVKALLTDVLPPRAVVLAGPIESGVNSLVNTVATRFVQSDAFETIWVQMNRVTHSALVAILTGKGGGDQVLAVKNGELVLDIGPLVEKVKTLLVNAGLDIASKVPAVGATFVIAQVKGVESARSYVRLLDRTADWLPVLAAVLIAAGVVVSKHRRRTLIIASLSIAGGMLVVGVGIALARTVYLNDLPGIYIDDATAGRLFDTVVRFLREGLRIVFVVALLVAVAGWLAGPSRPARAIRHGIAAAPAAVTQHWSGSPASEFIVANRKMLAVAVAALAALIIVFWSNPSAVVLVTIAVIALVIILVLYSFRSPTAPDGGPTDTNAALPTAT